MKKTIDILLSLTMILSLAACGNSNSAKQTNNSSVVETSPVEISVTTQEQSSDIQDTETSEAAQEQSSTTQENEHVDTIEMEYFAGIKLFNKVIDRLGVEMERQERYEVFDRTYEAGMREKKVEQSGRSR